MSIVSAMKPPRSRDTQKAMSEMRRILDMPVVDRIDSPAHIEMASRLFMHRAALDAGKRLLPAQANALLQFAMRFKAGKPGLLCPMGVGQGKTLTTLACAAMALSPDSFAPTRGLEPMKRAILIIPPNLHGQLTRHDIKWARGMIPLPYRVFDLTSSKRLDLAKAKEDGLYIMTYSRLSCADAEEIFAAVDPDIIIADEAHNLARRSAARTKRFMRVLRGRDRAFVCLSGTLTSKSPLDYFHLSAYSLKGDSPLPREYDELLYWAAALAPKAEGAEMFDPSAVQLTQRDIAMFAPLIEWASKRVGPLKATSETDAIRIAYDIRRRCTSGVIDSSDQDIRTSIVYDRVSAPFPPGSKIHALVEQLEESWVAPNGDEIDSALSKYKWHSELTVGFYNELRWPDHPLLDKAKELHAAQQEYAKGLREFLKHHRPGLDTPFLVGSWFAENGGGIAPELYDLWLPVHELKAQAKKEGWPERYAVPVRVDDYKIKMAVETAKHWPKDEAGILWVYHNEVGRWLVEEARKALPERKVVYAPAGQDNVILDPENQKPGTIVVASISSHGTGKNLQPFTRNLFVEGFPSAKIAEQAVGRTHRTGQTADELEMQILMGTEHDDVRLAAAINDAMYIHSTMTRQKMIYGTWAFTPPIMTASQLKTKGVSVESLTKQQQQELKEKFDE